MQYITDAIGAKKIDDISINEIGILSEVLMEKAAMAVVRNITNVFSSEKKIVCVCGTGNNGGDGIACARILSDCGYNAKIVYVGNIEKMSSGCNYQMELAQKTDITIEEYSQDSFNDSDIIIDAIFGTGLSRNVSGIYETVINKINTLEKYVVSVDIPSGIDAGSAEILGTCIHADITVTFGTNKLGLLLFPGKNHAGKVIIADDIFPQKALSQTDLMYSIEEKDIDKLLPARGGRSNKGTYGHVLVIAGSEKISGAAVLCANAAYRMGSGLVKVLTHKNNELIIKSNLPEALVSVYDDESTDFIDKETEWADVIVVGPGLGKSDIACRIIKEILTISEKPVIYDADAINILSECDFDGLSPGANAIITPHLLEAGRFLDMNINDIKNNMKETVLNFRKKCSGTIVLKDAVTLVADKKDIYVNQSGNNALSKGGSGDVLAGIIAALCAQGLNCLMAAALGTYLHGKAADEYVKENRNYSMLATDIINGLKNI